MARVVTRFKGKVGKMYFVRGKGKNKVLCEMSPNRGRKKGKRKSKR